MKAQELRPAEDVIDYGRASTVTKGEETTGPTEDHWPMFWPDTAGLAAD